MSSSSTPSNPENAPPSVTIIGYHQDDEGAWVAELSCGHQQHIRHQPPFVERAWTTTPQGRAAMLGQHLPCRQCLGDTRSE